MTTAFLRGEGTEAPPATALIAAALGRQQLSNAHRRIAGFLADNAPHSLFLSSPALAAAVGVSQPSVTRFARAAGFRGYADLQHRLRSLALVEGRPSRHQLNRYQAAVEESIRTLYSLQASVGDPAQIRIAGKELARSSPLVVLSIRAGAPVATYFEYYAARVHPDVRLLNAGGSLAFDGLTQARQAGGTAAICFLMPRYPTEVLSLLRYAREIGFRVIVVADRLTRVTTPLADVVLTAAVGSRLLFETYAGPMVMAGMLLEALSEAEPKRTRARLAELERMFSNQRLFTAEAGPARAPAGDSISLGTADREARRSRR